MPAYSQTTQAALLKAIGIFSDGEPRLDQLGPLDRTPENLDELTKGTILGRILHELDSDFDPSNLESVPGTSKHLTNKRNIQTIYKGLFRYVRRHVPELSYQAKKFDRHVLTQHSDGPGSGRPVDHDAQNSGLQASCFHLLAVMVTAAALGPDRQTYIPRMQERDYIDHETQAEIMQIICAMEEDNKNAKDDEDEDEDLQDIMEERNMDLLVEEQNVALRQELDQARKSVADYISRLEHLQMSYDDLKYYKEQNDRELEVLRRDHQDGPKSAKSIQALQATVNEQMEIIARYEEDIREHEKVRKEMENDLHKWEQKGKEADAYRDQVSVWKHAAEELEKKANTVDRYKQKLEAQQETVREVQNLQYEKADLQEQLRVLMEERSKSDKSRESEIELQKMIDQSEQHLWDERSHKEQLVRELAVLGEERVRLLAQRNHDEQYIRELQEQAQVATSSEGGGFDSAAGSGTLEDELNAASNEGQPMVPLEVSRLRAENKLLRDSTEVAAQLRQDLEKEKAQKASLQQTYNDMFAKNAVAENQIEALVNNALGEGTQPFIKLQKQWREAQDSLEQSKKLKKDLEMRLADKERDLAEAMAKLTAVEKGSVDAVNELTNTDQMISGSLKIELAQLRKEVNFANSQKDAQQTELVNALIALNKANKEAEEVKALREAAPSADTETANSSKEGSDKEKIGKLRERLVERNEEFKKAQNDLIDLHRKLKAAQGGDMSAAQKIASDQMIKNLKRENALITTAWHDLTSRLQSNHVTLQRRPLTPKSFLNRSRAAVMNSKSSLQSLTSPIY